VLVEHSELNTQCVNVQKGNEEGWLGFVPKINGRVCVAGKNFVQQPG